MIRCPRCDLTHPESAQVCARCGTDLRTIVVGYPDRDALASDREALELDGWQIVELKDMPDNTISVRYRRGPAVDPFAQKAPVKKEGHLLVQALAVLAVVVAVVVGVVLGRVTAEDSSAAVAAPSTSASLVIEGADGIAFSGSITGPYNTDRIQGKTPVTYSLEPTSSYTVVVQKNDAALTLITVTLTCSNGTRFSSSTAAANGIVSVAGQCG